MISTGLIIDTSGLFIAPAEAVSKFSNISIRLDDKSVSARVVGIDYQNGIALLKMNKPYGRPIQVKTQTGCAGQMILAIGNSYGVRAASALGICAGYRPDGMMQFSASFTPSSHGGGLFSMNGKLLGVITAQIGDRSEVGLAIPAYKIPEIVSYLKENGNRYAGYLGLQTREIEISPPIVVQMMPNMQQSTIASLKNRIEISHGLIVEKVAMHSPAYLAGFKKGDLLFQANKFSIDNPQAFATFIQKTEPGTTIGFDFLRHNAIYSVDVKVGTLEKAHAQTKSPHGTQSDLLADSILKEIQFLKEQIKGLESTVKQLRR